jgi:hypothetical protein
MYTIRYIKLNKELARRVIEDRYPYLIQRLQMQLKELWEGMSELDRQFIRNWYA